MSAYEENLQARREKLRDLVSSEEANLTREIVEVARRDEYARFEEKLARTEELRKQYEEEHEAMVAAKEMQRHLASCPDIKQELSRRSAIDAKQCNVAQMANNEARRLAEKKLDVVWHELMLRDTEAQRHKETEESERRTLAERETVSTLARQVADKLALEDEKKRAERDEQEHLERLCEDMRRAELRDLETGRQKREKLKGELEEQILTANKFIAERAREEAMADRAFGMLAEEELARERARAKQDTVALRAELDSYLKYLENLRQEEAKRNLEVEVIVRQSHEAIEAKRQLALKKFTAARRRGAQEVLRGREEQLKTRQEAEMREQRLKMEEREALERQIEMDADLAATEQKENRQKALRYGLELKEQRRCVEETRRRELEEERRLHRAEMKRRAEEYQRLADKLLDASESITPHPFKALLKERLKESPS
ncbi:PREDICTED: trichoplein keratin filament-binding protein-like [Vollenhovia emeryi]|uniref:trichoplein keratin filament-binding protein-like n=1 Tax=Vollenhovia emeryi TaxID=411798 RepID=UPI0005F572FC|nr:PREDICTED: trichoplein keratin filament-binding protein-like [Vollenhovia emeryi]